jgi:hypothetical protein
MSKKLEGRIALVKFCRSYSYTCQPYPKGVRGFKTVWYLDGHCFSRSVFHP